MHATYYIAIRDESSSLQNDLNYTVRIEKILAEFAEFVIDPAVIENAHSRMAVFRERIEYAFRFFHCKRRVKADNGFVQGLLPLHR